MASKSPSLLSSHGSSLRLLSRTNISLIPPPTRPLIDMPTLAVFSLLLSRVHRARPLARASGSGCWWVVTRMFFLSARSSKSLWARGLPRERRSTATAESATISTQDSTNAVDAVIGSAGL